MDSPPHVASRTLRERTSPKFDQQRSQDACQKPQQVFARREVIACGGAFNSPQLLMLSGIGPKSQLKKHRIPLVVDLPGVGSNLQDRYELCVVSDLKRDFNALKEADFEASMDAPIFREWKLFGKGLYSTNGSVIGLTKRSSPQQPVPDLYNFGVPAEFLGYFPGYSRDATARKDRFSWMVLKGHTTNRAGTVTLESKNPWDVPKIYFRHVDEGSPGWESDVEAVLDGIKFIRRMNQDTDLREIIDTEVYPGPQCETDDELRQVIRNDAWGHHASCTCRIGPASDDMTVLDSDFRVRGTRNLLVVDASSFPRIPGLFIAAAIYTISEKASDVICKAAG